MVSKKISPKEQRFAEEYLVDLNATAAARRAGYRGTEQGLRVTASRLLTKANVAALIQSGMDQRSESTGVNAKSVLERLNAVANRCMQAEPVMVFDHVKKGMVQKTVRNEKGEEVGIYEFDSAGANRALELLGKHLKLFTDKVEHSGKLTLEQLVEESVAPGKDP